MAIPFDFENTVEPWPYQVTFTSSTVSSMQATFFTVTVTVTVTVTKGLPGVRRTVLRYVDQHSRLHENTHRPHRRSPAGGQRVVDVTADDVHLLRQHARRQRSVRAPPARTCDFGQAVTVVSVVARSEDPCS